MSKMIKRTAYIEISRIDPEGEVTVTAEQVKEVLFDLLTEDIIDPDHFDITIKVEDEEV
jgi:hypothetical protein